MEKYVFKEDVRVLGKPVPTFPSGIGETFDALMQALPDGLAREYFGISVMEEDSVYYFAATREKFEGEAIIHHCESRMIEKGEYLVLPIFNWRSKLDSIKEIFHQIFQDQQIDPRKPCVEWYKSDDEMWCMVKVKS